MCPSPRSIDGAALTVAALLLAACQVEPAANNAAAPEVTAPEPSINASAPEATPPATEPTARYRFTGTEPFWGGTIDGAKILYQTPDDQAGQTIAATITKEGAAIRYSGTLDDQPFVLTLTPRTCSDGMSDTIYPIEASLTVRGEQRRGCANPLVGAQKF